MLQALGPGRTTLPSERFLPSVLSPLSAAASAGLPLEPVMTGLVRALGFDSFMYGASLTARPGQEATSYVFTTLPRAWIDRYDRRAYIEVDPRVLYTLDSAMPFVWDQTSESGRNDKTDEFLRDAADHGVCSGVAFAIHAAGNGHALAAFNSKQRDIDELRRFEIMRNLGDLFLLGVHFHELFMKTVIGRGLPPRSRGAPLSPQEKRCLVLAAHGRTSKQIAAKLGISERTVELHFSHIRAKLGAANRQEAISVAMFEGVIARGECPASLSNAFAATALDGTMLNTRRCVSEAA